MKISFFATLRPIVGQKTVEFELPPGTTVRQMVEIVVTRYPLMRAELLDEQGNLWRHVHVFVNGRDAPYLGKRHGNGSQSDRRRQYLSRRWRRRRMTQVDRVIRGIPAWLMGEYLKELGGTVEGNGRYTGPGWSARVEQIEDFQLGSLRVGQIRFQVEGEDEMMPDFLDGVEIKLLRGGG